MNKFKKYVQLTIIKKQGKFGENARQDDPTLFTRKRNFFPPVHEIDDPVANHTCTC